MESLLGMTFGRLTVIEFDRSERKKIGTRIYWLCLCACGNTVSVRADSLKSGHAKSCGCYNKQRVMETRTVDISGRKFGRLLILEKTTDKDIGSNFYWIARCDCGNTCKVTAASVLSGNSTSCGCKRAESTTTHGMSNTAEYRRAQSIKRLELKKNLDLQWSVVMQNELEKFFDSCAICGETHDLETDHVLPLSGGNGLKPGNAIRLCSHHNARKGNRPLEFMGEEAMVKMIDAASSFRVYWNSISGDNY